VNAIDLLAPSLWLTIMEKYIRAGFNHRRSMKRGTSRKISHKHAAKLKLVYMRGRLLLSLGGSQSDTRIIKSSRLAASVWGISRLGFAL